MSELTRRQARLVKRQISKLYGRNYIPLVTGDSTLSIGDILSSKNDTLEIIDSSNFNPESIQFVEGRKVNRNITSKSGVNLTTKLKGEAVLSEHFKVDEAGISVEFTSDNQMFLKVLGMRQQSIKNFVEFRKELLEKYTRGELSSKVYVVRGLVCADKFYLQYSGTNGGTIGFNIDAEIRTIDAEVKADFSVKWKKEVGYNVDGLNGGILAYRVSGVRIKRHLLPNDLHERIINENVSEADVLDSISYSKREELLNIDALELVDLTDEMYFTQEEHMV